MTFSTRKYLGETLGDNLRLLIEECQRDAAVLAARVRAGKVGHRASGRVEALRQVARWLERIVGNSVDLALATNINDCMLCLQQNIQDEACEANPVRKKQKQQGLRVRRTCARAWGKASVYADALAILSHLLKVHYPGKEFPLTLTAGNMSYGEFDSLVLSGELLSQMEATLLQRQEHLLPHPDRVNALLALH